MSSPAEIAALVFGKLSLSFGHRFLSLYEGFEDKGPDPWVTVRGDWAQELRDVPEYRILWALQNLPELVPDAPKFRALCYRAPPPPAPTQPAIAWEPKKPMDPRYVQAFAKLAEPLEDTRPEKVRSAARFIAKWGCAGVKLSPMKKDWLAHSRLVMAEWEREQERIEKERAERAAAEQGAAHA